MRRAEIKVGEVYGVRYGLFSGYGSDPVPARVLDVDARAEWRVPGYEHSRGYPGGGVLVEFVQPTRVERYFSLAARTNENAGKIVEQFVFHDKRPGCGGNVGRCFVGVWSELKKEEREQKRAEREERAEGVRRADAFAPALAAFRKQLLKVGLKTRIHSDASGLYGDVDIGLRTTGEYGRARPVGFDYEASLPFSTLRQLVEIAERHGEKVDVGSGDEE